LRSERVRTIEGMHNTSLRHLVAPLAALLFLACGSAAAQSSQMQVNARVAHYFRLNVLSQPRTIEVTAQDVARGYVDVPAPMELALESNSPNGYSLMFQRDGGEFAGAQVSGLGQSVQVAGHAAIGWRPNARRETMQFEVRLQLAPQQAPGSYRWPLQISISPA
jgi:hypothetical protein